MEYMTIQKMITAQWELLVEEDTLTLSMVGESVYLPVYISSEGVLLINEAGFTDTVLLDTDGEEMGPLRFEEVVSSWLVSISTECITDKVAELASDRDIAIGSGDTQDEERAIERLNTIGEEMEGSELWLALNLTYGL